jgi:hypothetical protein
MKKDEAEKGVEALKTLGQFITQTGFDPEKDLASGALAVFTPPDNAKPQIAFVAQANIVPDKMIAYIKTQNPETREESIDGVTFYHLDNKEGEEAALCFPKNGLFAMGSPAQLKKTVSLIQGKGRSLMDNPRFRDPAKKFKGDAIATAVFSIPEKIRTMQEQMPPPFEFDMTKAEAFTAEFFFKSDVWTGTLAIISPNPEGNKKNVNTLNSLKGFAALLGPEVGEVVNGLTISADDKQVEIRFSVTKAQLEKMGQKAKASLPGMSSDAPAQVSAE